MWRGGVVGVLLCAAFLLASGAPAAAEGERMSIAAIMRVGDHPGFGRVVFDLPSGARAETRVERQRVTVVFEGAAAPTLSVRPVRNLAGAEVVDHGLAITLIPEAQVRIGRPSGKLVLDLLDPSVSAPLASGRLPSAAPAPASSRSTVAGSETPADIQARPAALTSATPGMPRTTSPKAASADAVSKAASTPNEPRSSAEGHALTAQRGVATSGSPETSGGASPSATAPATPADVTRRRNTAQPRPRPPLQNQERGTASNAPQAAETRSPARNAASPAALSTDLQRSGTQIAPGSRASPGQDEPHGDPRRADQPVAAAAPTVAVEREANAPAAPVSPQPPSSAAIPTPTGEPIAIAASRVDDGDDSVPRMLLPFSAATGAAAYRAAGFGVAVFDERKPIDLAPFQDDSRFGAATVQLLTNGTMLRIPIESSAALRLAKTRNGWAIRIAKVDDGDLAPIAQSVVSGTLRLAARATGNVVVVPDDASGATLLVGTQRETGQAVPLSRRMPAFELRKSWQGVVVEPVTDALTLRPVSDGFVISADTRALPLALEDAETLTRLDASNFSRRYDFGSGAVADLRRRMEQGIATAAASPAQARLHARLNVAQAMLGLGMGAEAEALLHVATADEPRAVDDPDAVGLTAIAATLAGRAGEGQGLDDKRLDGTDDVALWRAVRAASSDRGADGTARIFAAQLPLVQSYPPPLRGRLLPIALRSMALGGEQAAVLRVLAKPQQDDGLELARAMALDVVARSGGDPAAALAVYDRLSGSADRLVRSYAAPRAAELRLATGRFTPAQAADALELQLFAWRGDEREVALRMRVAALRGQSGNWRKANELLRETEELWPDQAAPARRLQKSLFADAIAHNEKSPLAPLEMVALVEENTDLIPDGEPGRRLAGELSDRLLALDLPQHARPVLEKLLAASPPGGAQAEIADRLAALMLGEHDAAGALAVLAKSDAPDLPTELRERRALIRARAAASQGDVAQAIASLDGLDSEQADDTRAHILEQAKDWPAALGAVQRFAARVIPAQGPLDDTQAAAVLRLAAVAAQAGDDAVLSRLRTEMASRMPRGRLADLATILTGERLRGIGDLAIVAQEVALARRLPETLKQWSPPVAAR